MTLAFKPARKEQSFGRIALYGPPGGGKTFTGLALTLALAGGNINDMAVLDSEHESTAKYADVFGEFPLIPLDTYNTETYRDAVKLAVKETKKAMLIDSLSHAWEGKGGHLDRVTGANNEWSKVKSFEQEFWATILTPPMHMVYTMRSRNEWKIWEEDGRQKREVVGLEPVQRKGTEYEFDIVALMRPHENAEGIADGVEIVIEKSRYREVPRGVKAVFSEERPESFENFKDTVLSAFDAGAPPEAATKAETEKLIKLLTTEGKEEKRIKDVLDAEKSRHRGVLPQKFVLRAIEQAEARIQAAKEGEIASE
jgi:hypothetical protein